MIEGHNTSSFEQITQEEFEAYGLVLDDLKKTSDVISNLEKRRENVLKGGVNCIPFPFVRFRNEVPGVEQSQYVVVTANAKVGKSNLTDFLYVFNVLDYCFTHPNECSAHIMYFALEESVQRIIERYMCYLLYKLDNLRIAPADLRSTSSDYPLDKRVIDLLKSDKYQKRLKFFEECVEFDSENTNPTGILRSCEAYAKKVGKYKSHKERANGGLSDRMVDVFDSYEDNDPNHYKIVIIDHIGLVDKEQGFKTKDAVDKMSEYFVKYLRNRYHYTCVAIQQQASDSEGLEAIKAKKMMPAAATLGDSKYTARDANLVLGLFDPSKFGLKEFAGYIIDDNGVGLSTNGRFLKVIANRDGEMGGLCPLFFDGAVCNFEELPRANDAEIEKYYNKTKELRQNRIQRINSIKKVLSFFLITLFKNKK